jgi:hypothetical protein
VRSQLAAWKCIIVRERFKALPVTSVAKSLREGTRHAMLMAGLGPVKPNLVMIPWVDTSAAISPGDFVAVIKVCEPLAPPLLTWQVTCPPPPRSKQDVCISDLNLVVGCNFDAHTTRELALYQNAFGRRGASRTLSTSSTVDPRLSHENPNMRHFLDIWMVPLAMPASCAEGFTLWPEYSSSQRLVIQLAKCGGPSGRRGWNWTVPP